MYNKSGLDGRAEATPTQLVTSIKSVPTGPPKPMSQAVIQRLRESTRLSTQDKAQKLR